jgi:hypothetical protein
LYGVWEVESFERDGAPVAEGVNEREPRKRVFVEGDSFAVFRESKPKAGACACGMACVSFRSRSAHPMTSGDAPDLTLPMDARPIHRGEFACARALMCLRA